MLLRRVNESFPVLRMRGEMDRLMDSFLCACPPLDSLRSFGAQNFPAVNVWEDGDVIRFAADVPGIKMEDIKVSVLGNELTIEGERRVEEKTETRSYQRQERSVGKFVRVFHLPTEIDSHNVEATLRDGVLNITLPKAQAALPRKIEVKE